MSFSVELELNEEGYKRLSNLTDFMSKTNPAVTMGEVVAAVVEIGTTVAEDRIKNGLKKLNA